MIRVLGVVEVVVKGQTLGMIISVECFEYPERGREVEGWSGRVGSEIEAVAGDISAGDVVGVEAKAGGCVLRVILMIRRLRWEFLRGKRETQPVHGSHIYIYISQGVVGIDEVEQRDMEMRN